MNWRWTWELKKGSCEWIFPISTTNIILMICTTFTTISLVLWSCQCCEMKKLKRGIKNTKKAERGAEMTRTAQQHAVNGKATNEDLEAMHADEEATNEDLEAIYADEAICDDGDDIYEYADFDIRIHQN
jgi:hypothetical protein